ncbi:MAG TPA: hypothetical protein VLV78_14295 [Thermoanaerobaculia bacterium]|nr:hypothetical protein [Thermoanaerobaculia bacterium]
MKRFAILLATCILAVPLFAADTPKECALCVGAVSDLTTAPTATIPLLVETSIDSLPTIASQFDALTPEQRKQTAVSIRYAIAEGKDPLLDVETKTAEIVDWARLHGPFDSLAVVVERADPAVVAYAIKRLAVTAQGQNAASRIAIGRMPLDEAKKLYEHGAQSYFDALMIDGPNVTEGAAWLLANDPAKKIYAVVVPQSPNAMFDLAQALSQGATRAYLAGPINPASIASFNRTLTGDFAYDATSQTAILDIKGNKTSSPVLTFIRGEDLRALVVPKGDAAAATIVAIPSDQFEKPRRIDAAGERAITDTGKKGGKLLVGIQPSPEPYAIVVDRAEKPQANVTKEAIEVATHRGITVEEIIRNHQAYQSFQESIRPRYIARDTTKLRFDVGNGADAIEATIAGDYFSDSRAGKSDWIWQDFYINGVKWKYGRIPELPLIQPEKVTQLPLDIHLTNDYRYQLVRETVVDGYHTYEVRFEPPPNAPDSLPLYRGTVWIDARTWARIRISMVQLNLTGEVLSNEERVDFQPFARENNQPVGSADAAKIDARALLWLQRDVNAQQVISAAGRASAVLRSTTFSDFRLEPSDFEGQLSRASASDARMVRETQAGLRYLEKRGSGERVVKEGFDTARTFMLGGIHHDSGLQFPVVPLGGIDYFNFDLGNRGIQTNVFFAGVILAANATHPNVANTRTNLGADFFGIAVPVENSIFRNGAEQKNEAVKTLPLNLTIRAGHPVFQFGKIDLSFGASHTTYQRAEDTAPGFEVPADSFEIGPSLEAQYSRWGYTLSGFYDYRTRTSWKPWGDPAEYNPDQKTFANYGASFGKSIYLPKFQRIGIDLNYLDGQRLDRFSKYELGFFGAQRVHGIKSGSVRMERGFLGHLSYGFVFSDQFRMEAFYDQAVLDDTAAGYRREPFQGVGIAGQTVGPYGTLLRLDIGTTIGRNRQSGFVANVVFLKLF